MQSDSGSSLAAWGGALRRRYAASATSSRTSKTMMMVALVRLGMQGPVYHPHQSRNDSIRLRGRRSTIGPDSVVTLAIVILPIWAGSTAVWAGVAQLVEHLICNQTVGGSS